MNDLMCRYNVSGVQWTNSGRFGFAEALLATHRGTSRFLFSDQCQADRDRNIRQENKVNMNIAKSSASIFAVLTVVGSLFTTSSPAFAEDPAYCAQYAQLAVHEAEVLSTLPCFKGFDNRWHRDYARHYGWCLTAGHDSVAADRDYRRMRIAQCQGH
jgi:hypothetical protein